MSANRQAPQVSHQIPLWRQLFAVGGGPLAWFVQLNVGYSLTSYSCNPGGMAAPSMLAGWGWTRWGSLATNLAAALVAIAAGMTGLAIWRAMGRGDSEHTPDPLEGRVRFFGVCGSLSGFGFLAAILFDAVMILGAPACRG